MRAVWLAAALTVAAMGQPRSGFEYNGMVHVSWQPNEYVNAAGAPSREALAGTGVNWVSLLVTWYQSNVNSTTIAPNNTTPSDTALVAAIQDLHNKGLHVMLKPHVDLSADPNHWRGEINPLDRDAWFASYTPFIVKYAQMAEANGVEGLVIGTELIRMSGSGDRERWNGVIDQIKQVFHGLLTYSANATWAADEFTSVSFLDRLDLIGLDGYFPLTGHADPTFEELVAAWRRNQAGLDIVAAITNLHDAYQKPVIFTELGYRSAAGANIEPYRWDNAAAYGPTEQRNCYDAFYTVWSQRSAWMKGVFWWAWSVSVPGPNDTDYNPRGKPAEAVLRAWQAAPDPAFAAVGAASYKREAIAPGSIAALFGNNMAEESAGYGEQFPLPMTLAGAKVTVNGIPAPLFFVSPGQINIQVPFEAAPGNGMAEVTSAIGVNWIPVTIAEVGPGIFTQNAQGTGDGALLDAVTFRKITAADPATAGEWMQIYCTALGAVDGPVVTGASPAGSYAVTPSKPEVRVDGQSVYVDWAGLAAPWVGLYAINVKLPDNLPAGSHQLQVGMGGAVSNTVTFPSR